MKVIPLPIRGPDGKALPPWSTYDPPKPYKVEPAKVMYFSARHYAALNRVYSEMFAPVPPEVLESAGRGGKAPLLLQALHQAVEEGEPIQDWTPFKPNPKFPKRVSEVPKRP